LQAILRRNWAGAAMLFHSLARSTSGEKLPFPQASATIWAMGPMYCGNVVQILFGVTLPYPDRLVLVVIITAVFHGGCRNRFC
jgi:hypothetical protein